MCQHNQGIGVTHITAIRDVDGVIIKEVWTTIIQHWITEWQYNGIFIYIFLNKDLSCISDRDNNNNNNNNDSSYIRRGIIAIITNIIQW